MRSTHSPLHSERPKLYTILAFLSAKGLKERGANVDPSCEGRQKEKGIVAAPESELIYPSNYALSVAVFELCDQSISSC